MVQEHLGHKAHFYDFDDTIVEREGVTRLVGSLGEKLKHHTIPVYSLPDIPSLTHSRVDGQLRGIKELVSYQAHSRRKVYPSVREEFERIASNGEHIYGNTGRSNKGPWVDMTMETLQHGGIDGYFKDILFTPDGARTAISKADVIRTYKDFYDEVEFNEDDPRTAIIIARLFPDVQVNLIQYCTTGLLVSAQELAATLNIRRVAVFGRNLGGRN